MQRHEFLQKLHEILTPQVYLEIGVQAGTSLKLATAAQVAIGIDPEPLVTATDNQVIYTMTSDAYFAPDFAAYRTKHPVNFAFIDGDHRYEFALRDFYNTQRICDPGAAIVFDDVLPYNQDVGGRAMVAGHWAGDVWRVAPIIANKQPDLTMVLVDVEPTGLLLVWGLDPAFDPGSLALSIEPEPVPQDVLDRRYALDPSSALDRVRTRGV